MSPVTWASLRFSSPTAEVRPPETSPNLVSGLLTLLVAHRRSAPTQNFLHNRPARQEPLWGAGALQIASPTSLRFSSPTAEVRPPETSSNLVSSHLGFLALLIPNSGSAEVHPPETSCTTTPRTRNHFGGPERFKSCLQSPGPPYASRRPLQKCAHPKLPAQPLRAPGTTLGDAGVEAGPTSGACVPPPPSFAWPAPAPTLRSNHAKTPRPCAPAAAWHGGRSTSKGPPSRRKKRNRSHTSTRQEQHTIRTRPRTNEREV